MHYSSGIVIQLCLHKNNMQIELQSYSFDGTQKSVTTSTTTHTTPQQTVKQTNDGYNIIQNFEGNAQVREIASFIGEVTKMDMSQFKLVGAEFITLPVTIYRLYYEMIPFNLVQIVFVQ